MKSPTVSFVVPVRNDAARLEVCLRSIQANGLAGSRIEIIVVDNGSTDGSDTVARRHGALVLHSDASSVAELRNLGAARASGEILAFVDADHEISSAWVKAAVETFRTPGIGAVGSLCRAPLDGTWVQRAYGLLRGIPRGTHDVEWLGSGNLAMPRAVFETVGGFDITLTACEDVDLCQRVRVTGARIVSNADMRNVHFGDPATLSAVFAGERWRGRDNLRVSFRGPRTWKSLLSAIIPAIDVLMLTMMLVAVGFAVAIDAVGFWVAGAAVSIFLAGSTLRVVRAFLRDAGHAGPVAWVQAWVVACIYDLGRALALITRAPHRNVQREMVAAQ